MVWYTLCKCAQKLQGAIKVADTWTCSIIKLLKYLADRPSVLDDGPNRISVYRIKLALTTIGR